MLPWLKDATSALRLAHAADRMPHALLIHETPGSGGDWLSGWITQLVLCLHPDRAPCGVCAACTRVAARQHPDVIGVRPAEDSRQLRIEQVRELSQELALTSHQGGYKVGVITPADALNRFAANALLKTLEEPPPRTVLMLVATQPSRLPATILSRCQRVRVAVPTREQSVSWLQETKGQADWNAVLNVVGESPLLAAEAHVGTVLQIADEVRRGLEDCLAGTADPLALAERWARTESALRLRCFENWLTERIHQRFGAPTFLTEVGAVPYLRNTGTVLNIRQLFELLDGVRELKSQLDTPLNRGLALEQLLRRLAARARDGRSSDGRRSPGVDAARDFR